MAARAVAMTWQRAISHTSAVGSTGSKKAINQDPSGWRDRGGPDAGDAEGDHQQPRREGRADVGGQSLGQLGQRAGTWGGNGGKQWSEESEERDIK